MFNVNAFSKKTQISKDLIKLDKMGYWVWKLVFYNLEREVK